MVVERKALHARFPPVWTWGEGGAEGEARGAWSERPWVGAKIRQRGFVRGGRAQGGRERCDSVGGQATAHLGVAGIELRLKKKVSQEEEEEEEKKIEDQLHFHVYLWTGTANRRKNNEESLPSVLYQAQVRQRAVPRQRRCERKRESIPRNCASVQS